MAKIDPDEPCPCGSGLLFKDCHGPKVKNSPPPEITQIKLLKVIPEPDPDTRAVFIYEGEGTVAFNGNEIGLAMACGDCQSHLVVGISENKIQNIVIRCKKCGAYNET